MQLQKAFAFNLAFHFTMFANKMGNGVDIICWQKSHDRSATLVLTRLFVWKVPTLLRHKTRVSILEVVALWGDCMAFPADQGYSNRFVLKNSKFREVRAYWIGLFLTDSKKPCTKWWNGWITSTVEVIQLLVY